MKVKLSKFPLVDGIFISRPNRFIAKIMIDREEIIAHVPNTGRMSALLIPGNRAALAFKLASQPQTDDTRFQPNTNNGSEICAFIGSMS